MLTVDQLTKSYAGKTVVDHISFSVKQGEILGFLGPNGAGKSTTMNMITGYLGANDGTVTIDGIDIMENPLAAKKKIGYLPEKPPLYPEMTVREYLRFVYRLKNIKLNREEHIWEVCKVVHIDDVADRIIRHLSKGYRQRVGIAQALLGNPSLLILDEPTVGLDPKQIIEIRELISDLGGKMTVILSSHILSEVQSVCSRVLMLDHGHIVADSSTDDITEDRSSLHLSIKGEQDKIRQVLSSLPYVNIAGDAAESEPGVFTYTLKHDPQEEVRDRLFAVLAQHQMPIYALDHHSRSLEDVFLSLTGSHKGGDLS